MKKVISAFTAALLISASAAALPAETYAAETCEQVTPVCTIDSKYTPATPQFTRYSTSYSTITVKWKKVKDAAGYKVGIYKNGRWKNYDSGTANSCTFKKLDSHTKYKIRIRAYSRVNDTVFFSDYNYQNVATNRDLKSKVSFKIYESADKSSGVLYKGSAGKVVTQVGFSADGWAKVCIPGTKKTGFAELKRFAGYADLKIRPINQYGGTGGGCMYFGCEATSLATVLDRQYKISTSKNDIADHYIPNISPGSGDPNYAFWGTPYDTSGYGVYAPPVAQAANRYLKNKGLRNKYIIAMHTDFADENNPTGCSLNLDNLDLGDTVITRGLSLSGIKKELNKGHSLIIWWTLDAAKPHNAGTYTLTKGGKYTAAGSGTYRFTWIDHQHCAVVSGYDDVTNTIRIADVHHGYVRNINYSRFLKGYKAYSRQTVAVYPR